MDRKSSIRWSFIGVLLPTIRFYLQQNTSFSKFYEDVIRRGDIPPKDMVNNQPCLFYIWRSWENPYYQYFLIVFMTSRKFLNIIKKLLNGFLMYVKKYWSILGICQTIRCFQSFTPHLKRTLQEILLSC